MSEPSENRCELCGRATKRGNTEHHLIPRRCHSNKWFQKRFSREQMQQTISVCRDCHRAIHDLVPCHKQLGRELNTKKKLMQFEPIANHIAWMRKQR